MVKLIKYIALGFLFFTIVLIVLILWNPINALLIFNWLTLSAIACYSFFIMGLYLSNLPKDTNKIIRWSVTGLIALPIVFALSQMVYTAFYEEYWPVLFTLIIFQSVIGLMSLMNFFQLTRKPLTLSNIAILVAGLFALFATFVTLQKELNQVLYALYQVFLVVLSVLVISTVLVQYRINRKGNNPK
jgi:hypothetical protein